MENTVNLNHSTVNKRLLRGPACLIDDHLHLNFGFFEKTKHQTQKLNISVFYKETNRIDMWIRKLEKKILFFENLRTIEISFPLCFNDVMLTDISHKLAQFRQLRELRLNSMISTRITNDGVVTFGNSLVKLSHLNVLKLDFSRCSKITDKAIIKLGQSVCHLKKLTTFSLILSVCEHLTNKSLEELGAKLARLPALTDLTLGYNNCHDISDDGITEFCQHLSKMSQISRLHLNFYMCSLTDKGIIKVGESLSQLKSLKHLELFFSSGLNSSWNGIASTGLGRLSYSISKLRDLTHLSLKFGWCDRIDDDGLLRINNNIIGLVDLTSLELGLYFCENVTNKGLAQLTQSVSKLSDLKKLKLNFWSCKELSETGVIDTCMNVSKVQKLKHFEINSDNLGWILLRNRKEVIDFGTSLVYKKTHQQISKHKVKILLFCVALCVSGLLLGIQIKY